MSPDELQARLAAIVASSDDGIVSKDLNGIVQSWNAAAERIFGYTSEEMIGRSITTLMPPDRVREEAEILGRIRRGLRVDHFETVRQRKDGRLIDVSVTISPVKDSTGKIIGASKIVRDITEYRRLTHERERLYELARAMMSDPEIGSVVQKITDTATELTGAQFGCFFYNAVNGQGELYSLYKLSGAPRESFEKLPMPRNTEVLGPTFRGREIVRSGDITKDARYKENPPYRGVPFEHFPIRSYLAVPVISGDGRVLGGLFFGHSAPDVFTEHSESLVRAIAGHAAIALENARLQQQLQETAGRFQLMANSIPQLAWMARPDGGIFWYNQRWYEYSGTSPGTQLGWGWESIHDPNELPRVMEKWKACLAAGEPWEDTFPLRRHDGQFRWHLSRAQPFRDGSGKILLWFGTNTDITEQRELAKDREELLVAERAARSEAERVSRMKDEFLATLSHELRTPLNAILGWSQVIKNAMNDPETLREGLEVIERNSRVQTQLIEDLLDMSRIVSGKIRLDVQRVDLCSIIDAAIESVRPSADAKSLQLRRVLDPHAGPAVGDPNRLQQVVWNLLTNAIKFTPKGGKVEVLLQRIDSHLEIAVSDTGQGIRPEFLPHVFDRFRQADASTTRQHGGLGLGLAIVKQLVELHGGTVRAKSAGEGQGSTFCITLPLAVTKSSDDAGEHPKAVSRTPALTGAECISLEGVKVLVVDDEADARELIRRLLADCEAAVSVSESADSAIEMVKRQRPDVLVSDIGMPHKDGYQLIREIRQLPADQGGRTPAIALTAFARSEDRTRAMMAGYQVHISKPVEPQELIATLASVVGRTG